MKKIDKLILKAFFGPFILTLCVVVFIFLLQILTQYLNQFIGKDIDLVNYGKIIFYFSLISLPRSLPLAVLLSSLITYGNLGEYFELTAIKSAGISTWRAMRPVMLVVVGITFFSYWYNDQVAPWANLKGFSLLYDIKTAKATLNIKEGIFYNGLPGYNIKVDKKYPDGRSLKNLVVYRHPTNDYNAGNKEITLADSGLMYTINNKSYLVFELFNGNQYTEGTQNAQFGTSPTIGGVSTQLVRNKFKHYKMVVSLESFGLKRTDEDQFQYHEYMKDRAELSIVSDSLKKQYYKSRDESFNQAKQYYSYSFRKEMSPAMPVKAGKWIDSLLKKRTILPRDKIQALTVATTQARNVYTFAQSQKGYLKEKGRAWYRYDLEMHHKFTQSIACLVLFLIGAPLGCIIKKGGFGVPVLVSVLFFILMYVFTMQGDKWAKDGLLSVPVGSWLGNFILLLVGLYFTDRALKDSRLFDTDVYIIAVEKLKKRFQTWKAGGYQLKSTSSTNSQAG
jgi:lipopolysaccharide export system permease protein